MRLESIAKKSDLDGLQSQVTLLEDKYGLKIKIRIEEKPEKCIPTTIFTKELGISEAIVKYLKENERVSNKKIARILKTTSNNIAVTYYKAKNKMPGRFINLGFKHPIPYSIFDKHTPFQSIVLYYMQKGLRLSVIARILDRKPQEIWAVYKNIKDN